MTRDTFKHGIPSTASGMAYCRLCICSRNPLRTPSTSSQGTELACFSSNTVGWMHSSSCGAQPGISTDRHTVCTCPQARGSCTTLHWLYKGGKYLHTADHVVACHAEKSRDTQGRHKEHAAVMRALMLVMASLTYSRTVGCRQALVYVRKMRSLLNQRCG